MTRFPRQFIFQILTWLWLVRTICVFVIVGSVGNAVVGLGEERSFAERKAIIAVLGGAATLPSKSREPPEETRYGGRTLDEWRRVIKDLSPDDPSSKNAVPGLLEILQDQSAPWFTRRQVANTLGRLGPLAPAGVEPLVKILDEKPNKDHNPRLWATKALALYGPVARSATPRLIEILNNVKAKLDERQATMEALGQIGGAHPRAIPALVETIGIAPADSSPEAIQTSESLRELAVESVAVLGNDAAIAVPILLRYLNHPRESLRRKTVQALGSIGPNSQLAIPSLVELMAFDDSPAVQDAAEDALVGIGTSSVSALRRLLSDEDAELRERSARALGQIQPPAKTVVSDLRKRLDDPNESVRFSAAMALWKIRGQAEESLPIFVSLLASSDRQLRVRAYRLLTNELKAQAVPARESLKSMLDHPEPSVRQAVRKTLARIPESDGSKPEN